MEGTHRFVVRGGKVLARMEVIALDVRREGRERLPEDAVAVGRGSLLIVLITLGPRDLEGGLEVQGRRVKAGENVASVHLLFEFLVGPQ